MTTANSSSSSSDNASDAANTNEPGDTRAVHTWIFEPATSERNSKAFTDAGIEAIANHKYKAGHYTFLDNLLNPIWTWLTNLLPMWLAPNAVTMLGGLHCALSYFTTWYYSPNFATPLPDWVVFLSGYCTIAYYTLDCMDGKQARRTGQSSPLGQLFDHGFDCICNLAHSSTQAGYLLLESRWFFAFQGSLFFAFFMAQWEEYYTGMLPHAMGNFGVTEVNYSIGLFAIWNSLIDRERFWTTPLGDFLPAFLLDGSTPVAIPPPLLAAEIRYVGMGIWLLGAVFLCGCSFYRTVTSPFVRENHLRLSALSKLVTPFLIAVAPFWLPYHVLEQETRYISVGMGLLISFLTKKMICFSMARQTFASIQMEAFPYFGIIWLIRSDYFNQHILTDQITKVILAGFCVYQAYRLVTWAKLAIDQICTRLDINCLTIKHKKKD